MSASPSTGVLGLGREERLIHSALESLNKVSGITGTVHKAHRHDDGEIVLAIADTHLRLQCAVKQEIRRTAEIMDLRTREVRNDSQILITKLMSPHLALKCRETGMQFIDTAGNAYIRPMYMPSVHVFITGQKLDDQMEAKNSHSVSTPSGLKLIFALLSDHHLLNRPYQAMAEASRVAMGSISMTIRALEQRGFLAEDSGRRIWTDKEKLIGEWVAGYANRLRPKMEIQRFAAPDIETLRDVELNPETAVWGGEEAAARLTRYLKPEVVTIYTDPGNVQFIGELVRRYKLRRDPKGKLEIVQPFWDLAHFASPTGCAPRLAIYADLLLSGDARNIEAALYILREMVATDV